MLSKKNHNLSFCNNCLNADCSSLTIFTAIIFIFNFLKKKIPTVPNWPLLRFSFKSTTSESVTAKVEFYYPKCPFASLLLFSWSCFHSKSFIVYTWRQAITQFFVYRLHISNLTSKTTYFPIDLFFSEIISFSLTAIFTCLCRLATTFAYILLSKFSSKFYSFFSLTFLIPTSFCSSYSYIKASFSMICLYMYCTCTNMYTRTIKK